MRIDIPRQLGQIITLARKERGLTQGRVAELAGVSRQLVNRLEVGAAPGIALDNLLAIAAAVGCHLWVELDGKTPQEPDTSDYGHKATESTDSPKQAETIDELERRYTIDATLFEPHESEANR